MFVSVVVLHGLVGKLDRVLPRHAITPASKTNPSPVSPPDQVGVRGDRLFQV